MRKFPCTLQVCDKSDELVPNLIVRPVIGEIEYQCSCRSVIFEVLISWDISFSKGFSVWDGKNS